MVVCLGGKEGQKKLVGGYWGFVSIYFIFSLEPGLHVGYFKSSTVRSCYYCCKNLNMHQLEKEGQGAVADEKNWSCVKEFLNISEINQSIL